MSSDVRCRQRYRSRWLLVSLSLALATAACGSSSSGSDEAAPRDTNASSPTGEQAESVMIPTADGGQLDWRSLDGQDVVLWFWAPW